MTKVAAILIVKDSDDEAAHLQRCINSIQKHVDAIFINVNHAPGGSQSQEIRRILSNANHDETNIENCLVNWIETTWHDNFAEARNANLAQVTDEYDWIIWLDSDDTVAKPEKIRTVAEASQNYDCVYVDYDYDHDEHGNVTTVHMVGRLFKNNGSHHWNPKTRIHETLVETRSISQGMTKDFKVIHHAEQDRTERSFQRNIRMLEQQLQDETKEPDPRTFYYLACTYMDAGDLESAKQLFYNYLELSGWDQERSGALTKLGKIYLVEGNTSEAKKCFAWASAEDPNNPDPRVELGSLEVELEQWNKARMHLECVEKMDKNQTTLERNPLSWTFRTYLLLADCYLNMGGKWLDKAEKYAKKALRYKKKDSKIAEYVATIVSVNRDRNELQAIITKYKKLLDAGKKQKARAVLDSIPDHLADNPVVAKLRHMDRPFTWPKKSIVIMTGDTALDAWGPWSLAEGIGGSEEAIIRLAPKLAALGYKVVVYAKPGARTGLYDGVMWRNYWECNLEDEFDIFVAWRAPFIFEKEIKARKSYLWLHDVMEPGEFTEKRIANFTKCIVLSDYHRSLFPMIPDEKILMSGNGIDPEDFEYDGQPIVGQQPLDPLAEPDEPDYYETIPIYGETPKRDPHKVFYGSSHVRGLNYLYEIWPEVKAAVPDATLDVYYGRESYDKINRGNPERLKWMDDMIARAKELDGVTDHGKVGQDEIVRHMFESAVWAYPCPFPEIYCITAIKAQAAGAVPVSTDFAALNETVQFGTKIDIPNDGGVGRADQKFLDEFKERLIWWLQHPEEQKKTRPQMQKWARTKSWQAIAEQWQGEFDAKS